MNTSTFDFLLETETLLLLEQPIEKAERSIILFDRWCGQTVEQQKNALKHSQVGSVRQLAQAGRPAKPVLVQANELAKRGLGSLQGRLALLHSLAHIEFNAINLALDAVYRFRDVPVQYVHDWLRVASDEGQHFMLLFDRLNALDTQYGDLPAHDGLWEMARRTDHDILVRMALVPRILEARGLDVAPPMIDKLRAQKDHLSADILQRIYTDEITHVEIGNRWFRYVCEQRGLNGIDVFRDLLKGHASAYLRSPYNDAARLQAGFSEAEMAVIREMELEYKASLN